MPSLNFLKVKLYLFLFILTLTQPVISLYYIRSSLPWNDNIKDGFSDNQAPFLSYLYQTKLSQYFTFIDKSIKILILVLSLKQLLFCSHLDQFDCLFQHVSDVCFLQIRKLIDNYEIKCRFSFSSLYFNV